MSDEWTRSYLKNSPARIRPETHWFQERTEKLQTAAQRLQEYAQKGRTDGRLWFSLRLTRERAKELCNAFAGEKSDGNGGPNDFAALVGATFEEDGKQKKAVAMAPSSYAALCLALKAGETGSKLGTDILVHPAAFPKLEELWSAGLIGKKTPEDLDGLMDCKDGSIEITEAGLAIEGEVADEITEARLATEYKVDEPKPKNFPQLEKVSTKSTPGPLPQNGPVIIAIIDDGIGIANHRFRQAATATRIKHFLDLALIGKPVTDAWTDELLGRSWGGTDKNKTVSDTNPPYIDTLLAKYSHDEEQIYRALGLIDPHSELRQPLRSAVTHGTHVLDLAAGYDWQTEEKIVENRPIIAVQFPTQVAENRSDTWLPQSLKRALDWILVKADELSSELSPQFDSESGQKLRLPLVVNCSFASMAGPQDGCSDVERRITQFIKTYRGNGSKDLCTFVLAAGNSLQLRAVSEMDIDPGKVGTIPWRVLPDDKTPNFVEIWLPVADVGDDPQSQQVKVSLVAPRDAPAEKSSKLGEAVEWRIEENVLGRIYHQRFRRHGGSRECITIVIGPTADGQGGPTVPAGLWLIKVENATEKELRGINLRVHRDDVGMFARTGARQSYFDHPDYERFDPASGRIDNDEQRDDEHHDSKLSECGYWTRVTRQGTLSTYAFAEDVIAVAGYRHSDGEPADYSGAGLYRKAAKGEVVDGRAPDLAAVSEESPALPGVLASGTYSGSVAILNGTSVAVPQVVRALADTVAQHTVAPHATSLQSVLGGGAVAALKSEVENVEKGEQRALGRRKPRPGREHYKKSRPLRSGAGRLPFEPSYPKRAGD